MRVVVLGARGQLGQDICLEAPSFFEVIPWGREEGDLRHFEEVEKKLAALSPDVVWNTVALHRSIECEEKPGEAFLLNALLPRLLAELSRRLGFLLIHTSTDFVFDGKKGAPYGEWDCPKPVNTYGMTRYCGERYVEQLERYYLIRVSCLFGRGGNRPGRENFVFRLLKAARDVEEYPVVSNIWVSPSYTKDIARTVWKMIEDGAEFGTYHVVNGGGGVTWYEFGEEILRLARLRLRLRPVDWRKVFSSHVPRPLCTPLTSFRGTLLRPWQDALAEFLREIKGI